MKYTPNVNLQCPDQDSDILHTNYLFCGNMEKIDAYLGQWSGRSARINVSNYHWEVYDDVKKEWVDTGIDCRGNLLLPVFMLNTATGELMMFNDEEYTGPSFKINEAGCLEVVINASN